MVGNFKVCNTSGLVERSRNPVTVRGELVEPHVRCNDGPSTSSGRAVSMESYCWNDLLGPSVLHSHLYQPLINEFS